MEVISAVWRLLEREQRREFARLQFLSIAMGLSAMGGIAAILPFFTALSEPHAIDHSAVLRFLWQRMPFREETTFVVALGIGFVAAVLLSNALNLFGSVAISRFAYRVGAALHVRLFDEYMHRGYEFHARSSASALATKVIEEVQRVTSDILQQGLALVANFVMIVLAAGAIVLVNPWAAGGAVAGLGTSYVAIYVASRRRLLRNGQALSRGYAARSRTVDESFAAIKEIIVLGAQRFFVLRFAEQCRALARAAGSTFVIAHSPKYILECMTVLCLAAVALYLRDRPEGIGSPWMAQLSFIGFAAYRLLPALQQAFAAMARIRAASPALATIEKDLQGERRVRSERAREASGAWRGKPRFGMRLDEVSFRYAPDRPACLFDITLEIPAGAMVGLTGPNGAGKSTLLDLLGGLLVPESGRIVIDGAPLDEATRATWQSTIAYVPQQVFVFDATVAENIACGVPPERIDTVRLETAVRLARLSECVASLPGGYRERLGDRGRQLSGGQRQRIAIARALYRDASLVLLDEASSALDAEAEEEIIDTLGALRPSRTIVLIAHRTSSLRHCDVIFELRSGRLTASSRRGPGVPVALGASAAS